MYKFLHRHMFLFLLGICLEMEWLGHMVTVFKSLEELPDCLPKWLTHFTFPPSMYEHSSFSMLILVIVWHFDASHPVRCEGGISLWIRFAFLCGQVMLNMFSLLLGIYVVFLREISIKCSVKFEKRILTI